MLLWLHISISIKGTSLSKIPDTKELVQCQKEQKATYKGMDNNCPISNIHRVLDIETSRIQSWLKNNTI